MLKLVSKRFSQNIGKTPKRYFTGIPIEHFKKLNSEYKLGLTDDELQNKMKVVCDNTLPAFDRCNHLWGVYYKEIIPESNFVHNRIFKKMECNTSENEYNAWQCKTDIKPNKEGVLSGKTVVIKDSVPVAGIPCENGSFTFENHIPDMDPTIVTRILDSGGRIVGKSRCEDLCYSGGSHTSKPYPVLNSHDKTRHAGGSSSGSSVLVSLGECDMGISGDQGGSIRLPACWNGVTSFKASYGLIPYTGVGSIAPHFDHVGPVAKNMNDMTLLLQSIAGKDGYDLRQVNSIDYNTYDFTNDLKLDNLKGFTIGVLEEGFPKDLCEEEVKNNIISAVELMKSHGANVKNVSLPLHNDGPSIWCGIGYESQYTTMFDYCGNDMVWSRQDPSFNKKFRESLEKGIASKLSNTNKMNIFLGNYLINEKSRGEYFNKATQLAYLLRNKYLELMNDNKLDVLIMPTIPFVAPKLPNDLNNLDIIEDITIHSLGMISNTAPFNVTGQPALNIPVENNSNGLPIGMQIVSRMYDDKMCIKVGGVYEKIRNAQTKKS